MWTGTVEYPGGHNSRKGAPPADGLTIIPESEQGVPLPLRLERDTDKRLAQVICEIPFARFPVCPICLDPETPTREHVPHGAIGGQVRTMTCVRCNNQLGRFEAELTRWCFGELVNVRAKSDAVQGRRRIPSMLLRWTDDGQFVLIVDERADPAVREMIESGELSMEVTPPDSRLYMIAVLKHAYLAACCHLRAIPMNGLATTIRAELLKARDAASLREVPGSGLALRLGLMRSTGGPQGPPLALVSIDGGADDQDPWISLAGSLLVAWPLEDGAP